MADRYDCRLKIKNFYTDAIKFIEGVQGKKLDITVDVKSGLKIMAENPSWFSNQSKDYRAYYAFLDVCHTMVRYDDYRAKYNLRDKELEEALANWQKILNPKKNTFVKLLQRQK